jgi:hypothetical protein
MPWAGGPNQNPFPIIGDAAYTSHRVDEATLSRWDRVKRWFWIFGHRLKEQDILFAFKTGAFTWGFLSYIRESQDLMMDCIAKVLVWAC